jgi:hypothetical protein
MRLRDVGPVQMGGVFNDAGGNNARASLMRYGWDIGCLRPFLDGDGRSCITINDRNLRNQSGRRGKKVTLITNAPATLRKQEWEHMDKTLIKIAKNRLVVFGDLRRKGLEYKIPRGMGVTVLQHETQSDIGPAMFSMDGLVNGQNDRPLYELHNLPLPIVHKEFNFSARQLETSRSGYGSPLDLTMAELSTRKIAEAVESLTLGTWPIISFGGGSIYGYTNWPGRITYSMTNPTSNGWTPSVTVHEVLAMKRASQAQNYYGPWTCYFSADWDEYLDDDFSAAKGSLTLRERIAKIKGVGEPETVDNLTGFQSLLVQNTSDVARAVVGMDLTTVQWPGQGGLEQNYKALAIWVPQLREDQDGNTGIVHGLAA